MAQASNSSWINVTAQSGSQTYIYSLTQYDDGTGTAIYGGTAPNGLLLKYILAPVSSFTTNTTNGTSPLAVQFTDASYNSPSSGQYNATNVTGNNIPFTILNTLSGSYAFNYPGNYSIKQNVTNSQGSNISAQVTWINVTSSMPPVAAFSGTPTSGTAPLTVVFTDASINIPSSWLWDFHDGSAINNTQENPVHTFASAGTYEVDLQATNTYGSDWENKTAYISVSSVSAPVASFNGVPLTGNIPLAVAFTDTSTNTPTSWSWNFGDGNSSTSQNPSHTYVTAGYYTVNLTATNSGGSNTTSYPNYIVATTGTPSNNQQDIVLTPILLQTFYITDANTGNPINIVTLTDNTGNTFTTTNGTGYLDEQPGTFTVTFTATGYLTTQMTYTIDDVGTHNVQLSPTTLPSQNVWWTPHTVQITLMDSIYQNRLVGVSINATYNQSSIPTEWLNQLYGIQNATAQQMVNKAIHLSGYTGSDGTLTTTMLGSLLYDIYLNSTTYCLDNYHVQAYPSDSMLNIYVPTCTSALPIGNTNQTRRIMVSNVTEPNISYVTLWNYYADPTGLTTYVNMSWMFANNDTVIQWYNVSNPGTALVVSNLTMPNTRGTQVWWGINATLEEN